jgi:hypothetical protein
MRLQRQGRCKLTRPLPDVVEKPQRPWQLPRHKHPASSTPHICQNVALCCSAAVQQLRLLLYTESVQHHAAATAAYLHLIAWAACIKGDPELVAGPQRVADGACGQVDVLRDGAVFPDVAHVEAPAVYLQ